MNEKTCVLIIDDEPHIRKFLSVSLHAHGYRAVEAANAAEALHCLTTEQPEILILDLGLPDEDGMTVIRKIRSWSKIPIIVLSVRSDESDKVTAIDLGANDYITKPFGINELLARLRACLRDRSMEGQSSPVFEIGDLQVDVLRHMVTLRGERIHLSPKEFKLLKLMAANAGRVMTHKQLIREVWGTAYTGEDNQYLRIYIRQLRQKIELDRTRDHYIHNEPGVGYRLEIASKG